MYETTENDYDGVIIAGDITNGIFSESLPSVQKKYEKIMEVIHSSLNAPVYYVFGNRDMVFLEGGPKSLKPAFRGLLKKGEKIKIAPDVYITSDNDLVDGKTIYLTHCDGKLNSSALLHIEGHIHYGIRYKNYINLGFVWRSNGKMGSYWEIEIKNGKYSAKCYSLGSFIKRFRCWKHYYVDLFVPRNWKECPICRDESMREKLFSSSKEEGGGVLYTDLYDVPLLGGSRMLKLKTLGITTVEELLRVDSKRLIKCIERIKGKDINFPKDIEMAIKYARAIETGKPVVDGTPDILKSVKNYRQVFFLDTEYIPETKTVFLIGVMSKDRKVKQFFLDNHKQEEEFLLEFDEWLEKHKPVLVTYSGRSADKPFLMNAYKKLNIPIHNLENTRHLDLYSDVIFTENISKQKVYLPITDLSLKNLPFYLGYKPSGDSAISNGLEAPIFYKRYLKTGDEYYKRELLAYNQEDLRMIAFLFDKIMGIVKLHE